MVVYSSCCLAWAQKTPRCLVNIMGLMVLWSVAWMHISWAILLCGWSGLIGATPMALLHESFGQMVLLEILSYAIAGGLACVPLLRPDLARIVLAACLLPQQILLLLSALSSFMAIVAGHYADLVERHSAFIAADQLPMITLALCHTMVLWRYYRTGSLWSAF